MAAEHVDMHTHTVFSDGTTTPEQNVALACKRGLFGIAVTDHDTGAGIAEAKAAAPDGFWVIPGTEFSAELDSLSVHVLAYWPDFSHTPFADELHRLRNERALRAEKIVAKFNYLNVPITFAQVEALADGAPIGRPHIAQAVVDVGAAHDLRDVFDRFLADNGPCYEPKYALDPVAAVRLIVEAGGVAVLAHPGLYGPDGLTRTDVAKMVEAGLHGVEAAHPAHSSTQYSRYQEMARFFGLIATAGSDYHGEAKQVSLGDATTRRSDVERLNEHAAR